MNLPGRIRKATDHFSKHTALTWRSKDDPKTWANLTYGEVQKSVDEIATGLLQMGLSRGDRVGLFAANGPHWALCDLAILAAGGITVPIYATSSQSSVEYVLRHSQARFLIVGSPECFQKAQAALAQAASVEATILIDTDISLPSGGRVFRHLHQVQDMGKRPDSSRLRHIEDEIQAEDIATIMYTSGTTGEPKGVMLTHGNLVSNCEASKTALAIGPDDIALSFLPLSHALERTAGQFTLLLAGVTIAYAQDLSKVPQDLAEVQPTFMLTVPRMLEKFYARVIEAVSQKPSPLRDFIQSGLAGAKEDLRAGRRPSGLKHKILEAIFYKKVRARVGHRFRFFVSGGAALSKDIAEFFLSVGINVFEGYGLTETSPVLSVNRLERNKLGTVGCAISGVELKIASDGEILARGPNIMKGYYKNESATKEMIDPEGWLHTGDIGTLDEDGYLTITDRKKDIIVTSGGKNIAPQPMENELKLNPHVGQVCVIGDRRNYLVALIVPEFAAVEQKFSGKLSANRAEWVEDFKVRTLFDEIVHAFNAKRASFEMIKKYALIPDEWTIDGGHLTPTLKVKRKFIAARYAGTINSLYEGTGE